MQSRQTFRVAEVLRRAVHTQTALHAQSSFLKFLNPFTYLKKGKQEVPEESDEEKPGKPGKPGEQESAEREAAKRIQLSDIDTHHVNIVSIRKKVSRLVTDGDAIVEIVKKAALDNGVKEETWQATTFVDLVQKFKILEKSSAQIRKNVPNLELNNMRTVQDAIDFFTRKEEYDPRFTKNIVELHFKELEEKQELPPNLIFLPRAGTTGKKMPHGKNESRPSEPEPTSVV